MVYQLYFRCSCTQTVPPCGGSICYSPRATSATSPCQRLTLPMGSVWARSVPCVMAACFLTRPCQGLRRICWVTEIFFSLYSSSFSTLSGPISGTITLLSFSVNPVLITCLCTHITFSFVRIQNVSVCILTVYWKFFFFFLSVQISSHSSVISCVRLVTQRRRFLCFRPWSTLLSTNLTAYGNCPPSSR